MPAEKLVLAVDGGGSGTRAAVATLTGEILGLGTAGPANPLTVGPTAARQAMHQAIEQAIAQSGQRRPALAAAVLGVAGAAVSQDLATFGPLVRLLPADRVLVEGDLVTTFIGACPEGVGVVLSAGTGAVAFGQNAQGLRVRVDGWGPLLGDAGSGYAIGLQALRTVLQAEDGRRRPTRLTTALLAALGLPTPQALVDRAHRQGLGREEIAGLAPLVLALASQGDTSARQIVRQAARDLVHTAVTAVRRLGLADQPVTVALSGGLLSRPGPLTAALLAGLSRRLPRARVVPAALPPLGGALLLALSEAGHPPDETVRARLAASLRERLARERQDQPT